MKKILCLLLLLISTVVYGNQNPVITNILNRKSVRKYLDKTVEQEKIDTILQAAMAAPSAQNKQVWEFIVVTDKNLLLEIGEKFPNAGYVKTAPMAIIVCGANDVVGDYWPLECSAVTQNILLAAESLDLGAIWCGLYCDEVAVKKAQKLFNLPFNIIPLNIIPIGYPAEKTEPKKKFKKEKIHINQW